MATATDTILVNDRARALRPGETLAGLLAELGLADRKGVAVAVNGAVVPRPGWAGRVLDPEDRVLVIQATQGG
jgi:thiamine biosynthesis protein ThiS